MEFDGFDWDAGNWPKCAKHGLTQAEIEQVFERGVVIFDDPSSTASEARYRGIGSNGQGRMVFVVFCYRKLGERRLVRPISARYMHEREITRYEQLQGRS